MSTPIEHVAALTIGTVESVSPSEIKVLLDPNAPHATAINTGVPVGFPRINGYVIIPNETGAVVGMIVWLGVEHSAFPKRTGLKDFGLIDLPFPLRKLVLTPLGTLIAKKSRNHNGNPYCLERGISAYPSVGDSVLLPTADQLKSIIEASDEVDKRVCIGTSPLAADAMVSVDPDKLFGRHLAVLGNTGSGKSCTVAGLIRWSLEQARAARSNSQRPNARFIILDPNGEYSQAFSDYPDVRRFQVSPSSPDVKPLVLSAWMWNSQEWCAFAHAAPGVQRPLLLQALRDLRSGARIHEPIERQINRLIRSHKTRLESRIAQGITGYQGFPENKNCGIQLRTLATDARTRAQSVGGLLNQWLIYLADSIDTILAPPRYWRSQNNEGYNDFSETDLLTIINIINGVIQQLPDVEDMTTVSEDAPIEFDTSLFSDHLEMIAAQAPGGQAAQFISTLTMRIQMMLADRRLGPVVNPTEENKLNLKEWLEVYIGNNNAMNGELAILDLSLVPSDVIHIIVAVIARITFESIQRYMKINHVELPTVLVLEEAHTFIKKGNDDGNDVPTPSQMCRYTFERIAREGRKFGLGLVLSSQRPSELSQTVLAQCNTFILHRIVNDRDQELVGKLVPDNLGGLLKELPSLPSRQAILLGWAVTVPTLVEIKVLSQNHRPRSNDPGFWDAWTGNKRRDLIWDPIIEDWTGLTNQD